MPRPLALADLAGGVHVVALPMSVRFRGIEQREALLVQGARGWGEFGPFLEYDDAESARWLASALESAFEELPAPVRTSVPVNATVPAVGPEQVADVLARFDGCTTAKVKVAERGQSLAEDIARVAEVRSVLGPSGRVRVDANGGWSVGDAADALARLASYDLEYAEQPCADVPGLAALRVELARRAVDVPVAADESIRKATDPMRVVRERAADILVVKVAPLGGVAAALALVQEAGLPAVVSSALDTSVGIAAGVRLAAALPDLPYACGLATVNLLDGDVTSHRMVPSGGVLEVRDVTPDSALLGRWQAPADRRDWWLARFERVLGMLHG